MSIDDDILRKKISMQAAINDENRRREEANRLHAALQAAGMNNATPIMRTPSNELRRVISEAMPRMLFIAPKIIRAMPDGTIRVRAATVQEKNVDGFSFDVDVKVVGGKNATRTSIWFFNNGSVAYVCDGRDITDPGVTAKEVREKIIETIAASQIANPSVTANSSTPSVYSGQKQSSESCFIATAVYGSYDCPKVWVLRRYRDYILQPTWYGRTFIKIYYTISPHLVRLLGNKKWFRVFWRKRLDSMTDNLIKKGFSDKPYEDR